MVSVAAGSNSRLGRGAGVDDCVAVVPRHSAAGFTRSFGHLTGAGPDQPGPVKK